MKIAIAADHRGKDVFAHLCHTLEQWGHTVHIPRSCEATICDYPDMAYPVAQLVAAGSADAGILICGSGIGMSIAANKVAGIRAALVHDEITADMSRRHNNANVLCLSADLLGQRIIDRIVLTFLTTEFEGGRHARRIEKISHIERGSDPSIEKEGDAITVA